MNDRASDETDETKVTREESAPESAGQEQRPVRKRGRIRLRARRARNKVWHMYGAEGARSGARDTEVGQPKD